MSSSRSLGCFHRYGHTACQGSASTHLHLSVQRQKPLDIEPVPQGHRGVKVNPHSDTYSDVENDFHLHVHYVFVKFLILSTLYYYYPLHREYATVLCLVSIPHIIALTMTRRITQSLVLSRV